jgi:NTP pyrophosphatase (non-canonical NTP hydrolase)
VSAQHFHKDGKTVWGNPPYEESTLARVQRESGEWRQIAYPTTATPELQALGMAEEVGEVCHAVLKNIQQIRGYNGEKTIAEVGDGLADTIIYACGVATAFGIDLDAELARVWNHVRDRNITQGSMGSGNTKCPRCESPESKLHPAVQFEGEVQPCPHEFHKSAE